MIMIAMTGLFVVCILASIIMHEVGHYLASPKKVKFNYDSIDGWCCRWISTDPKEDLVIYALGFLIGLIPVIIFYMITKNNMWSFVFLVSYFVGCLYDMGRSVNIIRGEEVAKIYSNNQSNKQRKRNTQRPTQDRRNVKGEDVSSNLYDGIRKRPKRNTKPKGD